MGVQQFYELLQRVAEDMKLSDVDDRSLDDWVPIDVVKEFAREFIKGFENFMATLEIKPITK